MATASDSGSTTDVAMDGAAGPLRVTRERLNSIDLLRGIVMVVMALDHIRDFSTYLTFPPEDIVHTNGALFFTRWLTHFCAPVFFLLAGTGAYLSGTRKTRAELSTFLWKRGLWLVILEGTIVSLGWTFIPFIGFFFGGVIWCLGMSMIVLSVLVRLPFRWIAAFGLASIFLHNLLDRITPEMFGRMGWLWHVLHQPGFIPIKGPAQFFALYVLIPWTGVMAAGYAFGKIVKKPAEERRRLFLWIGGGATALFVVLRLTNFYGNPPMETAMIPWAAGPFHVQATLQKTVIAFFNVTKYPPSLQYLCMTLGPAILALAWFERFTFTSLIGRFAEKFVVFGRVPLFFYVLHLFACHIFAIVAGLVMGQPVKWMVFGGFMLNQPTPGYGHNLPFIWMAWVLICVGLYFPCKWFAELKQRRSDWWLSYM
jgi:uncharacterized membrane protein